VYELIRRISGGNTEDLLLHFLKNYGGGRGLLEKSQQQPNSLFLNDPVVKNY
jgi:hypothetical protein